MNNLNAVDMFSSLSHHGRLDLLRKLVAAGSAGLDVGKLSKLADKNIKTISAQLKILAKAGVVTSQQHGKHVVYHAEFSALSELVAYLVNDCCCGDRNMRKFVVEKCCA